MQYICLSQYSFIRCTPQRAYIGNQSTGKQLVYDAAGGDWLRTSDTEASDAPPLGGLFYLLGHCGVLCLQALQTAQFPEHSLVMDIPPIKDLTIEVTNRCNERCIHCYLPDELKDKGSTMNLGELKVLVDSFGDMGGQTVTLTGGEIFLHRDLSHLLQYIHQRQLRIIIYSNLIALSDEKLKELESVNVDHIQVSLYGINPEVHDRITGVKGSCVRTLHSIEKIIRTSIPLKIACPVMKENSLDVIPLLDYAKKKAIPVELELNITARENQEIDNLEHRLSVKEMEALLRELMVYDKEYTTNLLLRHKYTYDEHFPFAEYLNYPVCTAGHYGLYITSDGKVTTCPNLQGVEMGNVNQSSLKDIWSNSLEITALRHITECSFRQCINCEASDYCFRCFARNYTETGDCILIPKYACEMAFLAKKIIEEQDNDLQC